MLTKRETKKKEKATRMSQQASVPGGKLTVDADAFIAKASNVVDELVDEMRSAIRDLDVALDRETDEATTLSCVMHQMSSDMQDLQKRFYEYLDTRYPGGME
jgi:hypothetical protein